MQVSTPYNDSYVPSPPKRTSMELQGIGVIELEDIPMKGRGDILLDRRTQMQMTQQEVADMAGIQLRQYQRFESGERTLSASTLRIALAVCDALGLDPHRFV